MTLQTFLWIHAERKPKDGLRLGQRFVNTYIKGHHPAIYFAEDALAEQMIREYLEEYQYGTDMPPEWGRFPPEKEPLPPVEKAGENT